MDNVFYVNQRVRATVLVALERTINEVTGLQEYVLGYR